MTQSSPCSSYLHSNFCCCGDVTWPSGGLLLLECLNSARFCRPQIRFTLQKIPLFLFFTFAISSHAETKSPVPAHPLRINELLASNRGGMLDDTGASSDWIELHNSGDEMLRLAKFRLSSSGGKPSAWTLPNIAIEPGGYQLIWMSRAGSRGPLPRGVACIDSDVAVRVDARRGRCQVEVPRAVSSG